MIGKFTIKWIDAGFEPTCAPNPAYPDGVHLDLTNGTQQSCTAILPYPAKRIGRYEVLCDICGHASVTTTTGRVDDPKTLKVPCILSRLRQ